MLRTAQQGVKFLRYQFAVAVEFAQEGAAVSKVQGFGNPAQIGIIGGQDMGLLVIQVLDTVLHLAQEVVRLCQGIGCRLWHQSGRGQPLQGADSGARAQFGVLPTPHHLQ